MKQRIYPLCVISTDGNGRHISLGKKDSIKNVANYVSQRKIMKFVTARNEMYNKQNRLNLITET